MDIRIKGTGRSETRYAQIDATHSAVRASLRPPELGVYGSYRCSLISGVIAAGLTGPLPIWEFRWGSADPIAIIRALKVQALASTTAFAASAADASLSLFRATGFTALDGTNGTIAAFTVPKSGAAATRMAASQFAGDTSTNRVNLGGIVILNTSASGLTGGTKTVDSFALAKLPLSIIGSAAAETVLTPGSVPQYLVNPAEGPALSPLELSISEGLVLQCDAVTGTGTWRIAVDIFWDEVDPTVYFGS